MQTTFEPNREEPLIVKKNEQEIGKVPFASHRKERQGWSFSSHKNVTKEMERLVIPPGQSVKGFARVRIADFSGNFAGALICSGTVVIRYGATIRGHICADEVLIERGAIMDCDVDCESIRFL
jgi:hypothetical protein